MTDDRFGSRNAPDRAVAGSKAGVVAFFQTSPGQTTVEDAGPPAVIVLKAIAPSDGSGALNQIFRLQYEQLVRLCRLRIRSSADAEDLVQDAFLSARRAYPDKGAEELKPLVFTTLRNLTINYLKSGEARRRRASDEIGDIAGQLACNQTFTPERQLMDSQRLAIAQAAIDAMSDRRREALRLHRFEGLTYEEIARRLSVSPTAVRKHVAAALAQIAARLAEADDGRSDPAG